MKRQEERRKKTVVKEKEETRRQAEIRRILVDVRRSRSCRISSWAMGDDDALPSSENFSGRRKWKSKTVVTDTMRFSGHRGRCESHWCCGTAMAGGATIEAGHCLV